MMRTRRYRAVLLDIDGTLVDSVESHALAWHEALAEHGHEVRVTQIRCLIGMGGDRLVHELTGLDPEGRAYRALARRHGELFRERYLPRLAPIVGARGFVLRLYREGYHVAIASSAKDEDLAPLLRVADVEDLAGARASASEVAHAKPDPDIVRAAVGKLPVFPYEAVMIGDTPYDIAAARGAGVDTIAVATGGFVGQELAGAVAVFASVGELAARWDESPLA